MTEMDATGCFSTSAFTLRPGVCVREALGVWLGRRGWLLAIPLGVLALLGLTDLRFLITALLLALVVYPGVLTLVYFNHALSPATASNLVPHTVERTAQGVRIRYEGEPPLPPDRFIPASEIRGVEDMGSRIVIRTADPYDFVIIPTSTLIANEY